MCYLKGKIGIQRIEFVQFVHFAPQKHKKEMRQANFKALRCFNLL